MMLYKRPAMADRNKLTESLAYNRFRFNHFPPFMRYGKGHKKKKLCKISRNQDFLWNIL